MSLQPTGYCWECGRVLVKRITPVITLEKEALFCNPAVRKCQDKYERRQGAQVKDSKKKGYGLAGSTH